MPFVRQILVVVAGVALGLVGGFLAAIAWCALWGGVLGRFGDSIDEQLATVVYLVLVVSPVGLGIFRISRARHRRGLTPAVIALQIAALPGWCAFLIWLQWYSPWRFV